MAVDRAARIELDVGEPGVTAQRGQRVPLPVEGADVQPVIEPGLRFQREPPILESKPDQPSGLLQTRVPFRISCLGAVQVRVGATTFEDLAALEGALQWKRPKLLAWDLNSPWK